jgi:hypothetical protein
MVSCVMANQARTAPEAARAVSTTQTGEGMELSHVSQHPILARKFLVTAAVLKNRMTWISREKDVNLVSIVEQEWTGFYLYGTSVERTAS